MPSRSATCGRDPPARPDWVRRTSPRRAITAAAGTSGPPALAVKLNAWHTGLIPGTSTLLVRRHDNLNWAVLFNTEANAERKVLADLIDGPMHDAANAVKKWPTVDLFSKFASGT